MHYTVVTQSNTSVEPSIYDLVFLVFLHGLLVFFTLLHGTLGRLIIVLGPVCGYMIKKRMNKCMKHLV